MVSTYHMKTLQTTYIMVKYMINGQWFKFTDQRHGWFHKSINSEIDQQQQIINIYTIPIAWARAITTSWQVVASVTPQTTRWMPSTQTLSSILGQGLWVFLSSFPHDFGQGLRAVSEAALPLLSFLIRPLIRQWWKPGQWCVSNSSNWKWRAVTEISLTNKLLFIIHILLWSLYFDARHAFICS